MKFSRVYEILSEVEGKHSIYFKNLNTNETFTLNEDIKFVAASIIKIPLVAFVLKIVEEGKISLDDKVSIKAENYVAGTGIIKLLNKREFTIEELCRLAICVSDNCATNELIDIVGGFKNINKYITREGYINTEFNRKMIDMKSIEKGVDNYISAYDIGNMLERIAQGEMISKHSDRIMINFLKDQIYTNKLPAQLPIIEIEDKKFEEKDVPNGKVVVANKTGDLFKTQSDVGIFILPDNIRYILAICFNDLKDPTIGIQKIGEISKIIYDEVTNNSMNI